MPGRIPQEFINDLLQRVDIVEFIGDRLELKKRGKNYFGLCPFHGEKTAGPGPGPWSGLFVREPLSKQKLGRSLGPGLFDAGAGPHRDGSVWRACSRPGSLDTT